MIGTSTTFVIGAAASKPYGFPLGSELTREIRALTPQSDIFQMLIAPRLNIPSRAGLAHVDDLRALLADLNRHPAESIDGYLESRQEAPEVGRIGKLLIAAVMGKASFKAREPHVFAGEDWIRYITNELCAGAPTSSHCLRGNSGVTFVTFNFDHVIEERLSAAISAHYMATPGQTSETMLRVILVHGELLPLPPHEKINISPLREADPLWIAWTETAAAQINVVYDTIAEPTLEAARKAVHEATVVCFLGFGYHRENLRQLDIPNTLRKDTHQHVFESALGLLAGEQARVKDRFAGVITLSDANCYLFLRNHHVIRD